MALTAVHIPDLSFGEVLNWRRGHRPVHGRADSASLRRRVVVDERISREYVWSADDLVALPRGCARRLRWRRRSQAGVRTGLLVAGGGGGTPGDGKQWGELRGARHWALEEKRDRSSQSHHRCRRCEKWQYHRQPAVSPVSPQLFPSRHLNPTAQASPRRYRRPRTRTCSTRSRSTSLRAGEPPRLAYGCCCCGGGGRRGLAALPRRADGAPRTPRCSRRPLACSLIKDSTSLSAASGCVRPHVSKDKQRVTEQTKVLWRGRELDREHGVEYISSGASL